MDIQIEKAQLLGISDADWLNHLGILHDEVEYVSQSKEARGQGRNELADMARPGDRYVHPDPVYVSVARPSTLTQETVSLWLTEPTGGR